ncbi:Cytochrome c [Novipirellula aureliae]|uniref:Cytochrome c n=1 Tax=Novipirellula aureliae TaxID=2527966 RepID=A0A5C6EE46_9BACT|nr:cytochrome c [Novipirellula aureliae]TWU45816.1 Cytochrome c [Novipirellula aureliae]
MPTYQEEKFPIPTPGRLAKELRLRRPPWWMVVALLLAVIGTWIPLAWIGYIRTTKSRSPRVHIFQDMDKQAKFAAQSSHPWFVDGRAMRQPVEGTVARGHLQHDPHFFDGFTKDDSGAITYFTSLPSQLVEEQSLVDRGYQRYQIFCAVCHGASGTGDGLVNLRAIELKETKWVPATNLMTQEIRDRADGQIFQAIRDGVRNMPRYGSQIPARDRWAIVAYLRELQAESPVVSVASSRSEIE